MSTLKAPLPGMSPFLPAPGASAPAAAPTSLPWPAPVYGAFFSDSEPEEDLSIRFLSRLSQSIRLQENYYTEDSLVAVAKTVEAHIGGTVSMFGTSQQSLFLEGGDCAVYLRKDGGRVTVAFGGPLNVLVLGTPEAAARVFAAIDKDFERDKRAKVDLWYVHSGSVRHTTLHLNDPYVSAPALHPWCPAGYFDRYMASDAAVLFLSGEPGTGKTSLIRHEICERRLRCSITYDEKVIRDDDMFLDFVRSDDKNLLVVEDADDFLVARTSEKNPLITRFLNFSDGLIKMPKKKIVFTTNLSDFSKVDPALTRKGRCFGALESRALTYPETVAAAKIIGCPAPETARAYTLAELTHQGEEGAARARQAVGFAA